MIERPVQSVKEQVSRRLLPFVRKPARYIGGEINQIRKDPACVQVRVGLCFPDIYEIAMSHTGLAILYEVINRLPWALAERIFAPWLDAEERMRNEHIPLFSLESRLTADSFDIIGFSLTNELCYTNLLNLLDLAGLAVRSEHRRLQDPLIIAGGQAANCAEPIAPFVDLFVLGQGEEAVVQLLELYRQGKQQGLSKSEFLLQAARTLPFVYVPSLYEWEYDGTHSAALQAKHPDIPLRIHDAALDDFENAPVPEAPIVPFVQTVHDRITLEIMRGCPGRCRFCQASFCRRPVRYRSVGRILELAQKQYWNTGHDTIGLLSLSTGEYPWLEELVERLTAYFRPLHVGISIPSLRVQQQLRLLPKLMTSVRKSGLTIAVEAASEHLRQVINKPISDADLFAGVQAAYEAGFQSVKLYFMVGFPGETEADILQIVDLCHALAQLRRQVAGRPASVTASVSWLVPKPHTPFQWLGQKPIDYFQQARCLLLERKQQLRAGAVQIKYDTIERSVLEAAMGRGERRLADVIETAWRQGAKFDLWDETFDFQRWQNAFAAHGLDVHQEAQRSFQPGQTLPWAHLGGPEESYLLKHYRRALGESDNWSGPSAQAAKNQ
ncbi:MAG TPA: TIGR03960 family B12-binding radical SAM protein [Anaerohalosphaeraceae bacterium]|nr:TIGR03960 family B12-binding radical SAM protein [Anaerohalosphaeraceae bacterium]